MNKKNIFQKAFSIIEILLILAILGIVLGAVVPYRNYLIGKNRALVYANELRAALRFARSSAILFGEPVIFCGSKNQQECDGLWQEGRIIITNSGKILRVFSKILNGDKLKWSSNLGKNDYIIFSPMGFTKGQLGSFYYCPKNNPENALAIIVLPSGRTRISNRGAKNQVINCDF